MGRAGVGYLNAMVRMGLRRQREPRNEAHGAT